MSEPVTTTISPITLAASSLETEAKDFSVLAEEFAKRLQTVLNPNASKSALLNSLDDKQVPSSQLAARLNASVTTLAQARTAFNNILAALEI